MLTVNQVSNEVKRNLISNILNANEWQVSVNDDKIFVSTNNLVGTKMLCSVIDVDNETVILESHNSWNYVSWRSIDPVRGCINDFKIIHKSL